MPRIFSSAFVFRSNFKAAAVAAALAWATPLAAAAVPGRIVSGDGAPRCSAAALCYIGRWEFVSGRHDGRVGGRSARSFTAGDNISFVFSGRRLRIFGVTGPAGGSALLVLGKNAVTRLDFYAPSNRAHVLVYSSPALRTGPPHVVALVVAGQHDAHSRGNYVNVDQIEVLAAR